MILDFNELWKPYSVDGHTLDNTIRWLRKTATTYGIAPYLVDMALVDIFRQIDQGKEFPKDKCPCGCGIDKAGTAVAHAIRDKMFELDMINKIGEAQFIETKQNMTELDMAKEAMNDASEALKKPETKGLWQRIKNGLVRRS